MSNTAINADNDWTLLQANNRHSLLASIRARISVSRNLFKNMVNSDVLQKFDQGQATRTSSDLAALKGHYNDLLVLTQ